MSTKETYSDDVSDLILSFTHRRISRVIMYFFLSVGAIVSFFAPSAIFLDQSSVLLTRSWSLSFAIAAIVCLVGSLLDRWIFEYIMIPLLASIFVVFGIVLFTSAYSTQTALTIPYAMFFGAFSFGLFARWKDVQALLKITVVLRSGKKATV